MKDILEQKVEEKIIDCYVKAESILKREFTLPNIVFDLKGLSAGVAYTKTNTLRFNKILLSNNVDTFINITVPHEVAHLVADTFYNSRQCHGKGWKSIMKYVFGLEPKRCHDYDISFCTKSRKKYTYICNCREHELSTTLHNRISKGSWRYCKLCHGTLKLMEPCFT